MENRYKILVLSDLQRNAITTLNNSVELAKIINGDIEFFHVKKPTDVVERESQLSAIRTINEKYIKTDNQIKCLLAPISNNEELNVNYKYAFGNVKEEIINRINEVKPDVIVIGKRKAKALRLLGDNFTDFVLKKYQGAIMIVSDKNAIESNKGISLGFLNNIEDSLKINLAKRLIEKTKTPLKSFCIGEQPGEKNLELLNNLKTVAYVFEDNTNAIKTISDYVIKNKINLLCLSRDCQYSLKGGLNKAIDKVGVSILVT